MTMKEWAEQNNLGRVYNQYEIEVEMMKDELEIEGMPSNGSTFEYRLEAIQSRYPELFGDDTEWID